MLSMTNPTIEPSSQNLRMLQMWHPFDICRNKKETYIIHTSTEFTHLRVRAWSLPLSVSSDMFWPINRLQLPPGWPNRDHRCLAGHDLHNGHHQDARNSQHQHDFAVSAGDLGAVKNMKQNIIKRVLTALVMFCNAISAGRCMVYSVAVSPRWNHLDLLLMGSHNITWVSNNMNGSRETECLNQWLSCLDKSVYLICGCILKTLHKFDMMYNN